MQVRKIGGPTPLAQEIGWGGLPRAANVVARGRFMSQDAPTLSIGLAVRNGQDFVGRCIESVLSQDFTDLELVVCDNASDDGTITILDNYARVDRRLRFSINRVNI